MLEPCFEADEPTPRSRILYLCCVMVLPWLLLGGGWFFLILNLQGRGDVTVERGPRPLTASEKSEFETRMQLRLPPSTRLIELESDTGFRDPSYLLTISLPEDELTELIATSPFRDEAEALQERPATAQVNLDERCALAITIDKGPAEERVRVELHWYSW